MLALQAYVSSDEENDNLVKTDATTKTEIDNDDKDKSTSESKIHLDVAEINPEYSVQKQLQICAAPTVVPTVSGCVLTYLFSMVNVYKQFIIVGFPRVYATYRSTVQGSNA